MTADRHHGLAVADSLDTISDQAHRLAVCLRKFDGEPSQCNERIIGYLTALDASNVTIETMYRKEPTVNAVKRLITEEPVAIVSLIQALITLFVVFGVNVTDQQTAAILTFTTLLLGVIARSQVTPTAKID